MEWKFQFSTTLILCVSAKREKILARKLFCAPQKKHQTHEGGMGGRGRRSQSGKMNEQEISEFNDSEINENLVFRYFIHGAKSFGDEERLLRAARDGENWEKTFSFSKVSRLGLRSESRTLQRDYDEIKCRKNKAEWNFLLKKKVFIEFSFSAIICRSRFALEFDSLPWMSAGCREDLWKNHTFMLYWV